MWGLLPQETQDYNQPTEQSYQPYYQPLLLNQLIDQYKKAPTTFNDDLVSKLEQDAQFYGVRFDRNDNAESYGIVNTVSQLGQGFLSGFTTFHIGEEPAGPAQRIARSIGELAGFVGYVPKAPFALLSQTSRLRQAADFLRRNSLPMLAADKAPTAATGPIAAPVFPKPAKLNKPLKPLKPLPNTCPALSVKGIALGVPPVVVSAPPVGTVVKAPPGPTRRRPTPRELEMDRRRQQLRDLPPRVEYKDGGKIMGYKKGGFLGKESNGNKFVAGRYDK